MVTSLRRFDPRIDGKIRNARSLGWNLQLDNELINDLFPAGRLPAEANHAQFPDRAEHPRRIERRGKRPDPQQQRARPLSGIPGHGALPPQGHGSYHGVIRSVLVRRRPERTWGSIYGPTPLALIRPNERGPLRFDVPHRFLAWTEFPLPFGLKAIPYGK